MVTVAVVDVVARVVRYRSCDRRLLIWCLQAPGRVASTAGYRRGEATQWPLARFLRQARPWSAGRYARRCKRSAHRSPIGRGCGTSTGDSGSREGVSCERQSGCW